MDYSEADQKLANEMLNAGVKDGADEILGIDTSTMDPKTVRKLLVKKGILKKAMGGEIKKMKDGGDVPMPKRRPKDFKKTVEKQKKERAVAKGKVTVGGLNEMTDYDKEQFLKSKKMKLGGEAVPSKFKGFSKLPEGVQQKIDPKLASKYEMGGKVKEYGGGGKVKGGKMTCRGMGAAVKGGGFSIS